MSPTHPLWHPGAQFELVWLLDNGVGTGFQDDEGVGIGFQLDGYQDDEGVGVGFQLDGTSGFRWNL